MGEVDVFGKWSVQFSAVAAGATVALSCALMAGYFVPAFDGVDENGYILTAKRLAVTGDGAKYTDQPLEYVSENVVQTGEGQFYAKYPLGYPWLCALAYRLGGPSAVFWVNPILAVVAVVGMFLLGRALISDWAGALAAILLATNPLHNFYGLSALSHTGAVCFAIWGMLFLWRWAQAGGWLNAALAGALTAYACTIRYTEALMFLPVAAMVAARCREAACLRSAFWRRNLREVLVLAGAAAVVITPLAIHHWMVFGAPWRTGYALCGESTGFGWEWFKKNWWLMVTRLNSPGLMLIFPVGLVGLGWLSAHDRKRAALLGMWALPAMLLYAAYYWAPQGDGPGYIRFFVSVFPPLILAGLAFLCQFVPAIPLGAFVALAATANLRDSMLQLERRAARLQYVEETWSVLHNKLPADAVVVANGRTLNSVEYAGDYVLFSTDAFDRNAIKRRIKVLDDHDPHPFQRRKAEVLARELGDKTDAQLADMQRALLVTNVVAGRTVALIASRDDFRNARGRLGGAFRYDTLAEWVEVRWPRENELRAIPVTLYALHLRPKESKTQRIEELEEKIDQLQFKTRSLRGEFDERYPGARGRWEEITDLEKQLRAAQDQLKKLTTKK
jgi:hypothetical protein